MFPQFQRVVTLSVMVILVALFTWIYARYRQQRVYLWMFGWAAIVVHFAGMLLASFSLIPDTLAAWLAYTTLLFAACPFFLSVSPACAAPRRQAVVWIGIVAPA